jgi:hypothetical protein
MEISVQGRLIRYELKCVEKRHRGFVKKLKVRNKEK